MSVARVPDLAAIYGIGDLDWLRSRDTELVELIDGEVYVTPSPTPDHQRIVGRVFRALGDALAATGNGEVFFAPLDVVLDDATIMVPDIVVVLAERARIVSKKQLEGAPSMVVEVASPSTRRVDSGVKRDRFARAGVPEYWLLDPASGTALRYSQCAEGVYANVLVVNRDDMLVSATIDGLSLDLKMVFLGIGTA